MENVLINPATSSIVINRLSLDEYLERFKIMLVRRYNWTVTNANVFFSIEVEQAYNKNLPIEDAYYSIFQIDQDRISL